MSADNFTIVAIATPPGRGGVGIVRVSGATTRAVAIGLLGRVPPPRQALYGPFRDTDGRPIDTGLALFFPTPHSFTGEDVLELHAHGGPVVLDMLLRRCVDLGARPARPGEFSERAFLNDKLDLAQAEAIADLIDSATEQAARAALRSLQGEFSRRVHALTEDLIHLRMYIEAAIDFPEEEVDFLADHALRTRLDALAATLAQVRRSARQGSLLRDGMTLVIAGRPNAGKSSLLNALAGRDSSIVTDIPGTTRDVLREHISLDGLPLHVVDTAGLRAATDQVEKIGVERAWHAIGQADHVLLVIDDGIGVTAADRDILDQLPHAITRTLIRNKIDLSGADAGITQGPLGAELRLSALTGAGLQHLRDHLKQCAGFQPAEGGDVLARRRHLSALEQADIYLHSAVQRLAEGAGELAAEDLRLTQQALGEITGAVTNDDLLTRIFSSFCIGK